MSIRKIKDAKDLSDGSLIYFKGHAKATYMSDGTTVEDAINNIKTPSIKWSILKKDLSIKVGDIAYWDGSMVKVVSLSNWNPSLGTPVGVVVIPSGFLPDKRARIMSLTYMAYNGVNYIRWNNSGDMTDTSVPNHNVFPLTDNAGSSLIGEFVDGGAGYLPSDRSGWSGEQSFVDPLVKYWDSKGSFIPSPYLNDGSFNLAYAVELEGGNLLSDFNGLSNTQLLVNEGEQYLAAHACWDYKDPANSNLQWYLPAMGELGFLMPRFEVINNTLQGLSNMLVLSEIMPDREMIWSSSECSYGTLGGTPYLDTRSGFLAVFTRSEEYSVRSFALL